MLPPGLGYEVMCYFHVTVRFGLLSAVITMLPPGLGD